MPTVPRNGVLAANCAAAWRDNEKFNEDLRDAIAQFIRRSAPILGERVLIFTSGIR